MNPQAVLRKTAKGEQEIQSRTHGLERGLRTALILTDGSSSVQQIASKGLGMQGLDHSMQTLLDEGFVEFADGAALRLPAAQAKRDLIKIARAVLGPEAAKVVSKLEAAPDSRDGLLEAATQCKKIVRLIIDEKKAEELMARCQAVLGKL